MARGRTNAEISRDLGLTESTVKAYVSEILSSLGLGNRVQVALTVRDAAG